MHAQTGTLQRQMLRLRRGESEWLMINDDDSDMMIPVMIDDEQ